MFGFLFFFGFSFLMLALGRHFPLNQFFLFIPGWKIFRNPEKFMIFSNICFCFGLSFLWRNPSEMRPWLLQRKKWGILLWGIFFFLQIIFLLYLNSVTKFTRGMDFFKKSPSLVSAIQNTETQGRFYSYRGNLGPRFQAKILHYSRATSLEWETLRENVGQKYNIAYLAGYSSAVPQKFEDIWNKVKTHPFKHFSLYNVRFLLGNSETFSKEDPRLKIIYENKNPDYVLYENLEALPPYFILKNKTFPKIINGSLQDPLVKTRIRKIFHNNHKRRFKVTVDGSDLFWFLWSENLDQNWRAKVNQQKVSIQEIYPGIQAVRLQKDQNDILLYYDCGWLKLMMGIFISTWLATLIFWLFSWKRILRSY